CARVSELKETPWLKMKGRNNRAIVNGVTTRRAEEGRVAKAIAAPKDGRECAVARADDEKSVAFAPTKPSRSITRTGGPGPASSPKGERSCRAEPPAIAPNISASWRSRSSAPG